MPLLPRLLRAAACSLAALCCLVALPAAAQDYPNRPIRLIVGPGPDILARIVGDKLGAALGQPVVVDQRPAAGGVVAGDAVAKAPADGYTLLLSTGSYTVNSALRSKSPFDFQRDLAPVSLMATLPFILVVPPSLPAHNVRELVALAQAQPGKLNYASSGNGTPSHLSGEMFKQMARVDIAHVAYKGAAPALNDVLAGQVQLSFLPAPTALPLVKAGRLRAIAVSGPQRYFALPDVPTVAEQGYPEFAVVGWNGIHAPARTPPAIIDKLNREIAAILRQPDAKERAAGAGFETVGSTREQFEAFVKADIARAAAVIKAGNIQAD
ncbi:tripartite tricarboxylate transporter substrate binding protein [Ramlibacter sp.]|uniref:Bug family tripartite tricarboxylate transporter substrate binding protein n=1 Tax=Ramlibacter sp. TaxID=1917967 RepID=UPI0026084A5F|nr:tripartite tricarboxylate transporter substrate binding protein [Ramlibacter sp.]MDB5957963.1 tripartite tricarboxylate transporter substrate binding protein [Ramlibacter sp.]